MIAPTFNSKCLQKKARPKKCEFSFFNLPRQGCCAAASAFEGSAFKLASGSWTAPAERQRRRRFAPFFLLHSAFFLLEPTAPWRGKTGWG